MKLKLVFIAFLSFCVIAAAAPPPPPSNIIKIAYPQVLLRKDFYNSPYNRFVKVGVTVSGKKFEGVIPIVGVSLIDKRVFDQIEYTLKNVLRTVPSSITFGVLASYVKIAIIADDHWQKLTDLPDFKMLPERFQEAGGVGPTYTIPTQAIAETNAGCLVPNPRNPENVLIHEIAHTLSVTGLGYYNPKNYENLKLPYTIKNPTYYKIDLKTQQAMNQLKNRLWQAFNSAVKEERYKPGTYMIKDAEEYFAEGAQAYFNGQKRTDVNTLSQEYKNSMINKYGKTPPNFPPLKPQQALQIINNTTGINTYSRLRVFDPQLFSVMKSVFGPFDAKKPWNFCTDKSPFIPRNCEFYCEKDPY